MIFLASRGSSHAARLSPGSPHLEHNIRRLHGQAPSSTALLHQGFRSGKCELRGRTTAAPAALPSTTGRSRRLLVCGAAFTDFWQLRGPCNTTVTLWSPPGLLTFCAYTAHHQLRAAEHSNTRPSNTSPWPTWSIKIYTLTTPCTSREGSTHPSTPTARHIRSTRLGRCQCRRQAQCHNNTNTNISNMARTSSTSTDAFNLRPRLVPSTTPCPPRMRSHLSRLLASVSRPLCSP